MRVITMASLGASAVLGVAALFVARVWLPSQTASAAPVAAPAPRNLKPVVLAARPLAFGSKLEAKDLVLAQLPPEAAPEGAFTTIDAVLAQDHGAPVALMAISEREPLLPAKLSGPGARPSVAAMINEGMRAYAIRVTDVSGVGGNALPGDRVDVVLMHDLTKDGPKRTFVSEVVVQNIRLLGVDLNVDPASTQTKVSNTATLEVSVADAQKLAIASELGQLSLALRRTGAAETEVIRAIRASDIRIEGALSQTPRPAAPKATVILPPAKPARAPLIIVNGDKRDPVDVPTEKPREGV